MRRKKEQFEPKTELKRIDPHEEKITALVAIDYPESDINKVCEAIPPEAMRYLVFRVNGFDHVSALQASKASPIDIVIWNKIPEFSSVIGHLKTAEALMLESKMWAEAISSDKPNINQMFVLKSRLSEYKDNAPPIGQTITNVRITIDGKDYDSSASFKTQIGGIEDEL